MKKKGTKKVEDQAEAVTNCLKEDPALKALLEKSENGKNLEKLKKNDFQELFTSLLSLLKEKYLEPGAQESKDLNILNGACVLVLNTLKIGETMAWIDGFVQVLETLVQICTCLSENPAGKNLFSICEIWFENEDFPKIDGMEFFAVKFVLDICFSEKPSLIWLKKLYAVREILRNISVEQFIGLKKQFISAIKNDFFLKTEHGWKFLGYLLSMDENMAKDLNLAVTSNLEGCTRKKASVFGKMYIHAWNIASEDMKLVIMKNCVRDVMERFLKSERKKLELSKSAHNMIELLEVLHLERKKKNAEFVGMITEAYEPILWKYLKSEINVERCNAAELFFKAFPLTNRNETGGENEVFLHEQYKYMSDLLVDDCHVVRMIAVKEVCNILPVYWNSFTPQQIQKIMTIITTQDARDLSCVDVRSSVYTGMKSLLQTPQSAEYLITILPTMKQNIHDVNKKVRISFLKLLLAIKNKNDPRLKFTDALNLDHLCTILAEEQDEVGAWIMKLILSNFYQAKFERKAWMRTFIFLIKNYPKSYRNFFYYSKKLLSLEDAVKIMEGIITHLGGYVYRKTVEDGENVNNRQENDESGTVKRRKKKREPLCDKNNDNNRDTGDRSGDKSDNKNECDFDNPAVVGPLFDVVYLLWILYSEKLVENVEEYTKLQTTFIGFAQPFINYYKDTGVFLSLVSVFSNLPANVLRQNSITLPGYCINVLKKFNHVDLTDKKKQNEFVTLVCTLIQWGKCSDVLDHVTMCFESVFKLHNLDVTIVQTKRKRVQITETYKFDPIVAVEILDTIISTPPLKNKILNKSRQQLLEVWKSLSNVQGLILARLTCTQSNNKISDVFLTKCFKIYIRLLPVLSMSYRGQDLEFDTSTIDHNVKLQDLINWFDISMWCYISRENIDYQQRDVILSTLRDFLFACDNMLTLLMVNDAQLLSIGSLVLKLLDSRLGHHLLESVSRVACSMNFMCKCLYDVNTENGLWSRIIPSILDHITCVIVNRTRDEHIDDKVLTEIRKLFGKILSIYQDNYLQSNGMKIPFTLLNNVCYPFVDAAVEIIQLSITWDECEQQTLPIYTKLNQLPVVANHFVQLYHNNRLLTQHFLYCLGKRLEADRFYYKSIIVSVLLVNFFATCEKKFQLPPYRKVLSKAEESLKRAYEQRDRQLREERVLSEKLRQTGLDEDTNTQRTCASLWPSNAATFGDTRTVSISCSQADEEIYQKGFKLIQQVRGAFSSYMKN